MREFLRLSALAVIFVVATFGWLVLGGITSSRSSTQKYALDGSVADLWGSPLHQAAPRLTWEGQRHSIKRTPRKDRHGNTVYDRDQIVWDEQEVTTQIDTAQNPSSTHVDIRLELDQRRKGLIWFPLYDVAFSAQWTVIPQADDAEGLLRFDFDFPVADGMYDDFRVLVDGVEMSDAYPPSAGGVVIPVAGTLGTPIQLEVSYKSRGMGSFQYAPGNGVAQLRDFHVDMHTDFAAIDFPSQTMSPSEKAPDGKGWNLKWDFERVVTGHGVGMVMPEPVQPGPLAASLAWSAPISLGLFMLWIYVLGILRQVDIHPINHLFLAAAFFSFHLLFSYSADHLPVEAAFALSSVVSMLMTTSYLRLVAGPRFALVEAGGAQLLYLVGFSLAHFWEGYTGLTVTVLIIGTLFALGQLTGRIRWSEVFAGESTPSVLRSSA